SAAIREDQALGLNPADDGRVVRIQIPPLTAERRQEIAKQIGGKVEDAMISMRQARHDALKELDQLKKDKSISEDDAKRFTKQIEDIMQNTKQTIDERAKTKEQEILTV
ncbi:ribosome recycling factor, partial [Candidatus Saccharibacteria bacterium]|nr:ribosome recycling factor [Candidatus Saccharibacteria bacterium]